MGVVTTIQRHARNDESIWYEMTLKYRMTVEKYPKLNKVVGGSILGCVIVSLLDIKTSKVAIHLICSKKSTLKQK